MSQHILTLQPTDVLFFKDGRPMEGSSSGHGAAWPLPHILDSAIHHALRRASFQDVKPHSHTVKRNGKELNKNREKHGRQFGSLQSAGPFPIRSNATDKQWFFPRPADAQSACSVVTHRPLAALPANATSSLHPKLKTIVNTLPPSKDKASPWLSADAWKAYLDGAPAPDKKHYLEDCAIFAAEHNIGIAIDAETGTAAESLIYSASYLRLQTNFSIGIITSCLDKGEGGETADIDLVEKTFLNSGHENHILAGGQQRTCTVLRQNAKALPLPLGKTKGFIEHDGKYLVKWVLLTPAIYPHLKACPEKAIPEHPGGWLPSWIHPKNLQVQLKDPEAPRPARERGEARADYRRRLHNQLENSVNAQLVAALISKPIPVTGWALTDTHDEDGTLTTTGGAKSTHLAVPAGSVYYFATKSPEDACKLAAALNWHGTDTTPTTIRNRRSNLMGEKGYGLGVCGTWQFHDGH